MIVLKIIGFFVVMFFAVGLLHGIMEALGFDVAGDPDDDNWAK